MTAERKLVVPVARLTPCVCGHAGIEHYDSHLFCTFSVDGECDCWEFTPAGPEEFVRVAEPRAWD